MGVMCEFVRKGVVSPVVLYRHCGLLLEEVCPLEHEWYAEVFLYATVCCVPMMCYDSKGKFSSLSVHSH